MISIHVKVKIVFTEKFKGDTKFSETPQCAVQCAQCGNCRNSLSCFLRKHFVKALVLLRKFTKLVIWCSVRKLRKFSLTHFWEKFRGSTVFTKEVTKELISRNNFLVRDSFAFFHTVNRFHVILGYLQFSNFYTFGFTRKNSTFQFCSGNWFHERNSTNIYCAACSYNWFHVKIRDLSILRKSSVSMYVCTRKKVFHFHEKFKN